MGNNRIVADASGSVIQRNSYYPFGMSYGEESNDEQGKQDFKYNGKELDKMHGLNQYDYLARHMDPATIRFTTVDPLAEKYYSWSPYVYVANNPLRFIDPTGMVFWIAEYGDDGKVKDRILYKLKLGMEYKGENIFFKNTIALLNQINSFEVGNAVINTLSSSDNKFYYTNAKPKENTGGGTVPYNNGDTYFLMGKAQSIEPVAHEIFHGYQAEKGGGKESSIHNEVEASFLGYFIRELSDAANGIVNDSKSLSGRNNRSGQIYADACQRLLREKVKNPLSLHEAVMSFQLGSFVNSKNEYKNTPLYNKGQKKSLLYNLSPLIKY